MQKDKHILVITDNENSEIVRMLLKHKIFPVTRCSILSAMELLKHLNLVAIIIDKEHQNVDLLELILNARDIAGEIDIFIPEEYSQLDNWSIVNTLGRISLYHDKKELLRREFGE